MDFDEFLSGIKNTANGALQDSEEETDMHKLYSLLCSKRAKAAKNFITKNDISLDQRDLSDNTLLHALILNEEKPEVIKIAVELGFDVNALNGQGWSALYLVRKYLSPTELNFELHSWLQSKGALSTPDLLGQHW